MKDNRKTRHICVRFDNVKECVMDSTVRLTAIRGNENPADLLTKSNRR